MTRTNIDLDDHLVNEVIRRYGLATKKQAVDLALRRLIGVPLTASERRELEGSGWEGDLDEMRRSRVNS